MKITKENLKAIVQEEMNKVLLEVEMNPYTPAPPPTSPEEKIEMLKELKTSLMDAASNILDPIGATDAADLVHELVEKLGIAINNIKGAIQR